jgi:hypothetical protein
MLLTVMEHAEDLIKIKKIPAVYITLHNLNNFNFCYFKNIYILFYVIIQQLILTTDCRVGNIVEWFWHI